MDQNQIRDIVMDAMRTTNLARPAESQLEVSSTGPIFGAASPLDSLGLVALLLDVEDAFQSRGFDVALSDASAMSRTRSPFRDVPALVSYIDSLMSARP
ncbi:MAG TPA: hypothetical protein VGQ16_17625 [Vicinamibacterales bacterium]|jgi:acyl carrier protein|nr:hypothetical protein [Vicinamibacterales bacterium]